MAGAIDLYVSELILGEYKELLQRKSYPMDSRRAALLLKKLRNASTLVWVQACQAQLESAGEILTERPHRASVDAFIAAYSRDEVALNAKRSVAQWQDNSK